MKGCIVMILPAIMALGLISATAAKPGVPNALQYKDSIIIKKTQTNKKYTIKIYPNASHEVLFFSASGEEGKVYQMFLFTIDSKLVKQTQIRNRETTLIAKPEKGDYIFEVFSDDERIESGSLTIR